MDDAIRYITSSPNLNAEIIVHIKRFLRSQKIEYNLLLLIKK